MLAQVEPGEIRARLPAAPPERGEPFADVLRDLDEILLPGITHWQSPRFFAYFATTGAEPGILAELLAATLNSVALPLAHVARVTELEDLALDWTRAAARPAAGLARPHRGHRVHLDDRCARRRARASNGARVVVCSEEAHSSVDKAARLLGLETRKVPSDDEFRLDANALDLTDAAALVATVGTTSTTAGRSGARSCGCVRGGGRLATRRRGLRRARRGSVPSFAGRRRVSSARTRSS